MKNISQSISICITHVVNPHHFYFKYLNDCVNSEYSKFDYELQLYGNKLHAEWSHEKGYLPQEDERVIFFHIIFNKWVRGRVISVGQECSMWCIDNGIFEKSGLQFILPINERFRKDINVLHLGGLSLLPAEKKLNVETLDIEMQLTTKWDCEIVTTFKKIINTSKAITFTEEIDLTNHKLGLLTIESRSDKIFVINNTFVEMNKAAHCIDFTKDMLSYLSKDRLKEELNWSLNDGSTSPPLINTTLAKAISNLSIYPSGQKLPPIDNSAESAESFDDFDDSASMVVSAYTLRSENGVKSSSTSGSRHNGERTETVHSENGKADVSNSDKCLSQSQAKESSNSGKSKSENYDEFDLSASMALSSTITVSSGTTSSQSSSVCNENEFFGYASVPEKDYECFLGTCTILRAAKLRRPLASSMNWINSFHNDNVSDDNKSCVSSIINLNENDQSLTPASSLSNVSSKKTRMSMIHMLTKSFELTTTDGCNVDSSNKQIPIHKIVNKNNEKNNKFGVPAGYALNRLETFGGLTNKY